MTKLTELHPERPEQNGNPNSWPDIAKTVVLALVALACLGTAVFLIWFSYAGEAQGPREGLYKDIITFILSLIASIIIGHWYARLSNIEKVDTIAERSTEKMVLLSIQLEELRTYLEDSVAVAKAEQTMGGALNAYRHRTEAAAHLISSLANSNETFRGDWLGVVSNKMKATIEQKYAKLRQYFDANHTLRERHATRATPSGGVSDALQPEIAAAQQTIEEIRKDLPIPPFTPPIVNKAPAVSVQQTQFSDATDTAQKGELTVDVIRSAYVVVGTGKLVPKMLAKPWMEIELLSCPEGVHTNMIKTTVGVGTNFDFNVKIGSAELNRPLVLGAYKFRYSATARSPSATNGNLGESA